MKFKKTVAVALSACLLAPNAVFAAENDSVKVYIAGDSTACNYDEDEKYALPRAGWGMYLDEFLDEGAEVVNCARSGRSSKSLVVEDEYKKIFDNIKEGDYLLIQFGHNDAKNTKPEDIEQRYTNPEGDKDTEGSFKNSLYANYVKPAQEKGAYPVLMTPISRRQFDDNGKVKDSHGLYDDDVRELAEELGIPCIDMTAMTAELYNKAGDEQSKNYHALFKDTSKSVDNTHLNHYGAEVFAEYVAQELDKDSDGIGKFITAPADKVVKTVTRGEFTAEMVRLLDIEAEANGNFADVAVDNANYAAIAAAKAAGVVMGNEKGNFMPNEPITLQDAAVIADRALEKAGSPVADAAKSSFAADSASAYALSSLNALADKGIINVVSSAKTAADKAEIAGIITKSYEYKTAADKAAETSLDELEKVE